MRYIAVAVLVFALAACDKGPKDAPKKDRKPGATEVADPPPTKPPAAAEPEVRVTRRPVIFKVWDVDVEFDEEEELEEEEEEDETSKRAEGDEGKFGDPDIDPLKESMIPERDGKMVSKIDPKKVGLVDMLSSNELGGMAAIANIMKHDGLAEKMAVAMAGGRRGRHKAVLPRRVPPEFRLSRAFVAAQALQARYDVEDRVATNRYGETVLTYAPANAVVTVTMITYRETITDFITRFNRGGDDRRVKLEERELEKFRQLTSKLEPGVIVTRMSVKNLPLTQRSNPKDAADPTRVKACTDAAEDLCTFVYKISIAKPLHRTLEFVVESEYSMGAPGLAAGKQAQRLLFKNTGPAIFELAWPGATLRPNP